MIGHARAQNRQFYYPVLAYSAADILDRGFENAYGPSERTKSGSINFDLATGENILCVGRLERMTPNAGSTESRYTNREPYKLYWLPYAIKQYGNGINNSGDYARGNPTYNPGGLDPANNKVRILEAGMRVVIMAEDPGFSIINGEYNLDGQFGVVYEIVEAPFNITGDFVEHEATVVRCESEPLISLQAI